MVSFHRKLTKQLPKIFPFEKLIPDNLLAIFATTNQLRQMNEIKDIITSLSFLSLHSDLLMPLFFYQANEIPPFTTII